jgi:hypothetical protein
VCACVCEVWAEVYICTVCLLYLAALGPHVKAVSMLVCRVRCMYLMFHDWRDRMGVVKGSSQCGAGCRKQSMWSGL